MFRFCFQISAKYGYSVENGVEIFSQPRFFLPTPCPIWEKPPHLGRKALFLSIFLWNIRLRYAIILLEMFFASAKHKKERTHHEFAVDGVRS